jgi:hypothetical protein
MVVAWVVFPVVLLVVCCGCGLLVERLGGWPLAGGLVPCVGLASVIVVASLTTRTAATARLTTPVVVVLAIIGYVSSRGRLRRLRPDPWMLGAAVGVFAVSAAPVVLSGNATFLGYFILNDSAVHFALTDQLLAHGPSLTSLAPSAYSVILHGYMGTSYPTGADVALGAIRPLVGQDVAWIFQPFLAVAMALGCVAISELLDKVVEARWLRATCAFVTAQAGLVYAFYLEASVKEIVTTMLVTVTIALIFATLHRLRPRSIVALAVVVFAGFDVLQLTVVPWLGLPVGVFVIVAAWRSRHLMHRFRTRRLVITTAGAALALAALSAPLISQAATFVQVANAVLTQKNDLANLVTPLLKWQILGIWPSGDFRYPVVSHYRIIYALLGVAAASGVIGIFWAVRRRAFAPLLLIVGDGVAAAYLLSRASPYASAKVMMIFSLAVVLASMLGAAALYDGGRRVEATLLATVIAFGVLWTNALAYKYSSVAPRSRLAELASIGSRFKGEGPTFFNLSDEFAIHFLRDTAPTFAYWVNPTPRAGLPARTGFQTRRLPWDPNDLALTYLERFRLLVLGRSPLTSRPPANYQLAYHGRFYNVWRRTSSPQILSHVSLSSRVYPAAVPSCRVVMATAAVALREHARLAYVRWTATPTLIPAQAARPSGWVPVGGDPLELIPRPDGSEVSGTLEVDRPGRYQVWLDGSFGQRFQVWVGRKHVGSVADQLGPPGQALMIGSVTLNSGRQPVLIDRPPAGLSPNQDEANPNNRLLGPLMLVRDGTASSPPVSEIAPARAHSICGRVLNWIEVVR